MKLIEKINTEVELNNSSCSTNYLITKIIYNNFCILININKEH